MREIIRTNQFKKDVKRMRKRDADLERLRDVIELLVESGTLPQRYRPHKLSGEWDDVWECHIRSDWLLIYDVTDTAVWLARTGTHADLFGQFRHDFATPNGPSSPAACDRRMEFDSALEM